MEEIFGARKPPSVVRDASSEARRTADSTDCGQPSAHRTHLQRRAVPKAASCRTGRIFSARNGPRSEVIRLKRG